MPGRFTTFVVVTFWAIMMALLVREEVLPRWRAGRDIGELRASTATLEFNRRVRWRLKRDDREVGQAVTWWEKGEDEGVVYVGELDLKQLPIEGAGRLGVAETPLLCRSRTYLDSEWKLVSFETEVRLGDDMDLAKIQGKRVGERLDVTVEVGQFRQTLQFFYDPEAVWSGSLLPPDRYGKLKVGDKWTVKTVNPMRGTPELVRCEVVSETMLPWNGRSIRVYTVQQRAGSVVTEAWVTAEGEVLRQTIPFGWLTYEAERVPDEGSEGEGELAEPRRELVDPVPAADFL